MRIISCVCVPSLGKWKELILSGLGCSVVTHPRWIQVYMWSRSILLSCLKHGKMLTLHWTLILIEPVTLVFPVQAEALLTVVVEPGGAVVRSWSFILVNMGRKEVQSVWRREPIWFSTSGFNFKSFIFFTPPFIYSVDLYSQITKRVMGRVFHDWN